MTNPDPHAEEWKRAVQNGSYRDRRGTIVVVAAVLVALAVLGGWIYAFYDTTYVYAGSGRDASWEIIKRGILLSEAPGSSSQRS